MLENIFMQLYQTWWSESTKRSIWRTTRIMALKNCHLGHWRVPRKQRSRQAKTTEKQTHTLVSLNRCSKKNGRKGNPAALSCKQPFDALSKGDFNSTVEPTFLWGQQNNWNNLHQEQDPPSVSSTVEASLLWLLQATPDMVLPINHYQQSNLQCWTTQSFWYLLHEQGLKSSANTCRYNLDCSLASTKHISR